MDKTNVKFNAIGMELVKLEKTETEKADGGQTEKFVAEFKDDDLKVVITAPWKYEGLVMKIIIDEKDIDERIDFLEKTINYHLTKAELIHQQMCSELQKSELKAITEKATKFSDKEIELLLKCLGPEEEVYNEWIMSNAKRDALTKIIEKLKRLGGA